ncbi:ribbon-helix-helix protein, CopG family [Halonotius terrestris]|uniref:Ribbon-helix-helix protein, CopG family n=1 Tax=Halonotius terrestris TaxID=2487750 RepID=A0A8J8P9R1_9EURY|nr:UPF0175 family protein [Halonotius terrestris]TQQ81225.1 ribbon-helix-helix protein, CopG family [Halonotius terrestris]
MPSVSARIPDDDNDEIEAVAELLDSDKSTVIREALREGLEDIRLDLAVEQYQTGDVSANQAARIAGLSLADWLVVARERNLTTQLTPADLDADAEAAREL